MVIHSVNTEQALGNKDAMNSFRKTDMRQSEYRHKGTGKKALKKKHYIVCKCLW